MSADAQTCPHCNAVLHYAGDAFCPECRNSLSVDEQADAAGTPDVRLHQSAGSLVLPFNKAGTLMLVISALLSWGICHLIGDNRDGTKLAVIGPISAAIDLGYRVTSPSGHWLFPNHGGKLLFVPVWFLGVFWIIYGVWQLL
jgi:hypothetical protein